ncbi:hypothetical protein B0H10DRAFT_2349811, partial [Mycena sp. CBHHK59/15]
LTPLKGLHILYRAVATGASHDSGERFPPPRCHPETRTKMLQELRDWSSQMDASSRVLWLHGPAGAGKSAIVQTLSQQLADKCLVASFFFKRGDSSRGNAWGLFPTISYQLATVLPEFQSAVLQQVEKDPSVVNKSLAIQLYDLVIKPFKTINYRGSPFILIIDGLDECNGQEIQQEILRSLGNSLHDHSPPLRILIASRPEPHIHKIFEGPCFSGLYCTTNVEQSFEDVRRYLRDQFARIQEHHDAMAMVPSPWPTAEVLERLVDKSSGYFIYASTIIKYVEDEDFRPTEQLEHIEQPDSKQADSPFATLDQLYTQILSEVPDRPRLLNILCLIIHPKSRQMTCHRIQQLLRLGPGGVHLALRRLQAVLALPANNRGEIKVYHASFRDFLMDEARSGIFCVDDLCSHLQLAQCILDAFSYTSFLKNPDWLIYREDKHPFW